MTIYVWGAIAVVILTLAALIRRYDTKLVLLIAGLAMCCLSMNPMAAFQQFDKSMTNSALIISFPFSRSRSTSSASCFCPAA